MKRVAYNTAKTDPADLIDLFDDVAVNIKEMGRPDEWQIGKNSHNKKQKESCHRIPEAHQSPKCEKNINRIQRHQKRLHSESVARNTNVSKNEVFLVEVDSSMSVIDCNARRLQ